MMEGMEVMSMSHMCVVPRLFVVARFMMFRCLSMMLCRVLVVFRRLAVVFRCRLRHCIPSFSGPWAARRDDLRSSESVTE
jgi:hypothetical protein